MATSTTINGVTFHRGVANCNHYGNERVVVHYKDFLTDEENQNLEILEGYYIACKRAKKIHWREYKGRNFGGGFVREYFTTFETLANEINEAKQEPKGYRFVKKG